MLTQLRKKREEGGFTLIELLIVIIILGILAAVVVLSINAIRDRGDESACKTEAEQIRVALAGYFTEEGGYPADLNNTVLRSYLDDDIDDTRWTFTPLTTPDIDYTLDGIGDCDTVTGLSGGQGV